MAFVVYNFDRHQQHEHATKEFYVIRHADLLTLTVGDVPGATI
jgi:hypothetical protein